MAPLRLRRPVPPADDYGNFTANWQKTYVSKNNLKTTNDVGTPESVYVGFGSTFRTRSN